MFELAYPFLLLLLPAPLLIWWLLPPHRVAVDAVRVPFFQVLVAVEQLEASDGSVILPRSTLQMMIAISIWCLLVVGVAKPERVGEPIVKTEAARDIMLAIDISGSMDYVDFSDAEGKPTRRLDVVKRVVDSFVSERVNDRVGLIVFGSKAYLQLPFTRDLTTARDLLALSEVGMAGPHTALGDAIGLSIRSFQESKVSERLLVLLTDGNDTASKMTPLNAAEIARQYGVEIFTIGVGDPEASGEDKVDFSVLQEIARRTDGKFFTADNETALTSIYTRIDELAPAEVMTESWRPRYSFVHYPIGLALLIALTGYGFILLRSRR